MIEAPKPRENPRLVGHGRIETILKRLTDAGNLHHAWLITGPEGIGKATLAHRFARSLLAGFPATGLTLSEENIVFRQCAAGTHPDLIDLGVDGERAIAVEEVRKVAHALARTPIRGGWRVVVVDGVERLSGSSANALLKLLEEPPARVVFLLSTSLANNLPKTLRSRCVGLRLTRLSDADLRQALSPFCRTIDRPLLDRAIEEADGSPGKAIKIIRRDGMSRFNLSSEATRDLRREPDELRRSLAGRPGHRGEPKSLQGMSKAHERWRSALLLIDAQSRFNLDERHVASEIAHSLAQ